MEVSIIIPYFKRKEMFLNQIRSIAANDYPLEDYEVIVVEDGTNDFCAETLKRISTNIRYENSAKSVSDKKRTPPRNQGIELASGNILIFLDCDQIVDADFIRQHVLFHHDHESPVVQLGTRKNLFRGASVDRLGEEPYEEDVRHRIFRDYECNGAGLLGVWALCWSHNMSVPKVLVERYGGFDDSFINWGLEDVEFGYRMHRASVPILHNPLIEVYHQYHPLAYGARVYSGWLKNYEIFCEKYPDDDSVVALRVVADVLDPRYSIRLRKNQVLDASALHYKRFETILRCLKRPIDGADTSVFPVEPLMNSTATELTI